jgi:RNA polymerase sigma-70 factor (ECF subfamily)
MYSVNTTTEAVQKMNANAEAFDMDATFRVHYGRVAHIIGRVVRDQARAEELAVEVFLKLWRKKQTGTENLEAWLYRVAVRTGLDELRSRKRRTRYEGLFGFAQKKTFPATPEQVHSMSEKQERVRSILARIEPRQAEFLVLRSHGFSYEEVARILHMNPSSVGTLLVRAQQAFRKEYIKKYGHE